MTERLARWVLVVVGLAAASMELIAIVGVGLELVRHGPSGGNRAFGVASLCFAGAAVALLVWAALRGWLPKAIGVVVVGLVGVFLIAVAPGGV